MKSPHPSFLNFCPLLSVELFVGLSACAACLCVQDKSRNALLRAAFNETSEKWEARLDGMSGAQARRRLWEMTEQQRLVGGPCRSVSLLSVWPALPTRSPRSSSVAARTFVASKLILCFSFVGNRGTSLLHFPHTVNLLCLKRTHP